LAIDWSREEVEAIVADYLQMLALELAGQSYNKTEHRRQLQSKLSNRSDSSIEFKHCNISAAMIDLGFPYITGYQRRSNYQQLVLDVAASQVAAKPLLDDAALAAVQQPAVMPDLWDFAAVKADAPTRDLRAQTPFAPSFTAVKRDYFERESLNRSLGLAGEEFVLQFEHWRLIQMGKPLLADRIEHVSKLRGDGLGYDVLSFDADGRERLIEVKTTSFGCDAPFFVSRGELALSKTAVDQFHLYRLFKFRKEPKLFDLLGPLDRHCQLDPVTYKASFS
jgi:hypothetical protein